MGASPSLDKIELRRLGLNSNETGAFLGLPLYAATRSRTFVEVHELVPSGIGGQSTDLPVCGNGQRCVGLLEHRHELVHP